MANSIKNISIIGSGKVATQLALGLYERSFDIIEIWSLHAANALELSKAVDADVCEKIENLKTDVDLVIISVKDDALSDVVNKLPPNLKAVIHTSGGWEMNVLDKGFNNIGVLYPLQSFIKDELADWRSVPICVESNNDVFTKQLFDLAKSLSNEVEYLNSTQRGQIHIAAVFANNFSNYVFSIAYELAVKQHLPFSLLIPLIKQTASRQLGDDPFKLQTGPAKRNDVGLIKKHIEQLSSNKEAQAVYEFLSNEIIKKGQL